MADLLTASEVAKRWGCTRFWVNSLIRRGKLKAEKVGGIYMIRIKDADAYQHQPGGRPPSGQSSGVPQKRSAKGRVVRKTKATKLSGSKRSR